MPRVSIALIVGLSLTASSLAGQSSRARDDVGQRARDAVRRLARVRREHLPRGLGAAGDPLNPCPTRIGRICHWSEGEDAPDPPPDAPAVVEARARAVALLDSAAALSPFDGWVAGQRVRLLTDAGMDSAAVAAARACRGDAAWCKELAGYALHRAGDYGAADSTFTTALGRMAPSDRCQWNDISALLDGALRDSFARANCAARDSIAERLWWLAAPLYLVSTVDARTEYYARLTRARMADDAPESEFFGWDDDTRRTAVRFGWPLWYSQDAPYPGQIAEPAIVGHERGGSYYFFPTLRALASIAAVDSTDWRLDDARAPSAYAPAYARSIHGLPAAIARFRRGSRMLVIATWDGRTDSTISGPRASEIAGLFVGHDGRDMAATVAPAPAGMGALGVLVDNAAALASLEVLDTASHTAARARRGVAPFGGAPYQISDLMELVRSPVSEHPELRELVSLARMPRADSTAVLYFELYTPRGGASAVTMQLRLAGRPRGWAHGLAERLHLARPPSALSLQWTERPDTSGTTPRALRLDLSRIEPGEYDVSLVARDARGAALARAATRLAVGVPL